MSGSDPLNSPSAMPQLVAYPGSPMLVPRRPKPGTGVTWHIREVAKILDGDTIHAWRQRWDVKPAAAVADGLYGVTTQMIYDHPVPGQCRLYDLDTPDDDEVYEAGDQAAATADLTVWLQVHEGKLMVETWPGGGFGRWLADVFIEGDRTDTLTAYMHREGWRHYTG